MKKHLLSITALSLTSLMLLINVLAVEPAPEEQAAQPAGTEETKKPKKNPFAQIFADINKKEEQIKKLDAVKDAKKIEKIQKDIDKAQDNKDKLLAKLTKPLETKMDELSTKVDKLKDKKNADPNAIAKLETEMKKLDAQITELKELAEGEPSVDEKKDEPAAAAQPNNVEKEKGALKKAM